MKYYQRIENENHGEKYLPWPIAAVINNICQCLPSGHSIKARLGRIKEEEPFEIFFRGLFFWAILFFTANAFAVLIKENGGFNLRNPTAQKNI